MRLISPPTDSKAYCSGESPSTDSRTVCASKPSGPRKLKSTVLDEVTVALVAIRNCRRYDWMLARRALHSATGCLMGSVFFKSKDGSGFVAVKFKQKGCQTRQRRSSHHKADCFRAEEDLGQ